MSTTLPNGQEVTVSSPNGVDGLYQVVKAEFVDGYSQNNLDSAYDGLAALAREERLASAPTIPNEAETLRTMMDYDATSQTGGNPRTSTTAQTWWTWWVAASDHGGDAEPRPEHIV